MIREIKIENYKSIQKLKLNLGRVTVLIGENGSGKSNILEAIALGSAAVNDKLDREFLVSRGIRVTEPQFMRSAFEKNNLTDEIKIGFQINDEPYLSFLLQNDNSPYSKWISKGGRNLDIAEILAYLENPQYTNKKNIKIAIDWMVNLAHKGIEQIKLHNFIIYSPEHSALQTFEKEGQIQPLGIKGEGLFKLLKVFSLYESKEKINELKEKLKFINWFKDLKVDRNLSDLEKNIKIQDRYIASDLDYFDQKSANEGFLFLLFYFALFISDDTPNFFAIDNIDASLNHKLCSQLMKDLVELSKKYNKQVIFTTHNPAILDGLNLDDEEQRLVVIYRNKLGHTKAKYIDKPKPLAGEEPVKLSEAFLRGYIGGIPKNF